MEFTQTLPFGKHKGQPLSSVPGSYLWWLLEDCDSLSDDLRVVIEVELRSRLSPAPRVGVDATVIRDWFRRAALACHPDRGGSVTAMRLVNELRDLLI
jgi:hypothetical protein